METNSVSVEIKVEHTVISIITSFSPEQLRATEDKKEDKKEEDKKKKNKNTEPTVSLLFAIFILSMKLITILNATALRQEIFVK